MPRPRTPKAKAKVIGQDVKRRKKFAERSEPVVSDELGAAPAWMNEAQASAWQTIAKEIPWLNSSHRSLVEIAAYVRARLMSGEDVGVPALTLLRQCLNSMGATPADASKARVKPDGEGNEDPADEFFNE